MGFFDKLKNKAKQVAGDALQAAAETAEDKVKGAVSDKLANVTEQATSGALAQFGVAPGGVAPGAVKDASDVVAETAVKVASDAADAADGSTASGEPQAE
jgi:ABC-type Na+ efflux pump permease subunit